MVLSKHKGSAPDAFYASCLDTVISWRVLRDHRRPCGIIRICRRIAAVKFLFQIELQRLGINQKMLLRCIDSFSIR